MDNKDKLSGIERQLVLQYLIDGNVPVTLTPLTQDIDDEAVHSLPSQIFPVALKPDHIKVTENGKIYLENPNQSVMGFADKNVKVEFYFNRVGLFFISKVTLEGDKLVLFLPEVVDRIKDEEETVDYDFSALIYFECKNKHEIDTLCVPWQNQELFVRPAWKSIPLENQINAKQYLEEFVNLAKIEKNVGNGIQLVPVCNYLTYKEKEKIQSIQNRKEPLSILYVDHERIVLGLKDLEQYNQNDEYGLKLSFSIKNSPILSRDIFVTFKINKIYQNKENNKFCLDCIYTTIQEEDLRYIYEKATKKLFI